jgi:hypothetical protein
MTSESMYRDSFCGFPSLSGISIPNVPFGRSVASFGLKKYLKYLPVRLIIEW